MYHELSIFWNDPNVHFLHCADRNTGWLLNNNFGSDIKKCSTNFSILNANGERPLTAYLIHSIPLLQSAVQIFAGDKMTVVAHLVGLEQIGYEKILGMSMGVSKNW